MEICDYGCGKEARYQFKNGKWCCSEDVRSCSGIKEKKKQTNLKTFGVEYPSQNKKTQEKRKQTFMEKYGVDHNFKNQKVQEKRKQTFMEKYGVIYPMQNKEVQEKKKHTNMRKYGVEHPSQSKEVQEKMKQTSMKKYGVENPSQNKKVQEKKRQTCIEKYGVEYSLQNKEVQEKRKQTNTEKYGAEHPAQSLESKEKLLKNHQFFCQIEEIKIEDNQFKIHCKNSNCVNSKEQGGWFIPTLIQLHNRIGALEDEDGSGGNFFYCSEHCKTTCVAFNIHGDPERDTQLPYTQEQFQTFRLEVLTRDNYICQYCGKPATVVHHERPVKLYPESALDPDYAWSCCGECHYAKGHPKETSCSTGALAAVVCKPKKEGKLTCQSKK